MQHYPIFLAVADRRIVLSGGGDAALAKLRLLLKTEARVSVYSENPAPEIQNWAATGQISLVDRAIEKGDARDTVLFYAANEDATEDARVAELARADGALVNIVDNLADSQFITPAIVDRDPVTVAIGTEGAAPVLARAIKADLEERLPPNLGVMARIGKAFRAKADALPMGKKRRAFWAEFYAKEPQKHADIKELNDHLEELLQKHLGSDPSLGRVDFVGAGPGDPELLTLKARKALDAADVVLFDRLVSPEILELARREATMINVGKQGFGPSISQSETNALMVAHAKTGAHVVRLKSGDPTVFGRLDEEIDAVQAANVDWHIIPGITSASAAVAGIGQSLTKRGRNASVRFLTGHVMEGFAEQDWRALAVAGEVAAIYMGKKSARFIQGRLLMHGADAATPVTVIENASRQNQRVLSTTLAMLPTDLDTADLTGPALMLYGLTPRAAVAMPIPLERKELSR